MEDKERYKAGERAIAPLVATVVPALVVTVLMVVTAISSRPRPKIGVDIVAETPDVDVLTTDDPPPEPPEPVDTPDVDPEIAIDSPVPSIDKDQVAPPQPTPPSEAPVVGRPTPRDALQAIRLPTKFSGLSESRFPANRARYLTGEKGVGDQRTESAVMKALRWLKKTQRTDGSWAGNPVSNTGLAVLSYLAHGEVPSSSEEFGETVQRALDYLLAAQTGEGDDVRFRGADGNEYAFLIATYALGEAYGMTQNPNAKVAALKGLGRIIRNQSPTGGWDYRLNRASTRDDLSFAGWALQALKAGKMAGLHPEGLDACIKKAVRCLEKRNFRGGGFGYTAGGGPTGLTATGCHALQLLGFGDSASVAASLDFMRAWLPAFDKEKLAARAPGACPQYYCYYAAQCKYQAGMRPGAAPADVRTWQDWNTAMKALYPSSIITPDETIEGPDGRPRAIGYWRNGDAHGSGEVMSTCLCALQLMVYYRYLATTQAAAVPPPAPRKSRKAARSRDVCIDVDI